MSGPPPDPRVVPKPWRPRFGLGTLLLAMLVVSVMAAAGSYAVRAWTSGSTRSAQFIFILFTLATPVLLMVAVSVFYQVFMWLERSRKR